MSKHSKIPDDLSNLDADILTFLADQDSNVPDQSLFDDEIDQPVSSVRESFDSSATLNPEFVPIFFLFYRLFNVEKFIQVMYFTNSRRVLSPWAISLWDPAKTTAPQNAKGDNL